MGFDVPIIVQLQEALRAEPRDEMLINFLQGERDAELYFARQQEKIEKKVIHVTFEAEHGIPTTRKFTLSSSVLADWMKRHKIVSLRQPDDGDVDLFSDLVNNGEYRALCETDGWKHREQVDDSILEVEASNKLLSALAEHFPHSHLHHNVRLFDESGKRPLREYDALIHGHEIAPSIGFLVEGKYVPHPTDVHDLLYRAAELQGWLKAGRDFPAKEGTLNGLQRPMNFQHLFNIQRVVPVLAGKLFHQVNIDECVAQGVLPVYPSGAKYVVRGLSSFLKMI